MTPRADTPTPDISERDPVEVLAEEYFERRRRGESPSTEEYAVRFPDLAGRIREVFPAMGLLEEFAARPERLGEYRIVREVGRGGMGVVYEAEQESLGRRVALKVLPAHAANDRGYLERFRREAHTAARLHHTNVVSVFGAGTAGGVHFLAMQLIDGNGLDHLLADLRDGAGDARLAALYRGDRPAYFRAVAECVAQAADGLAHAHALGVIHRDVKPSNLLLDAAGTLWVSDFGLAKAEGSDDMTQTGAVVGTPRYLSPERIEGVDGPAADVYALGATLYELLTLKPAFDEAGRDKLLAAIRTRDPVRPRALAPDVPRDLETVTLKCLEKDPAKRYTASELTADLRRFLGGRPIHARRVSPVERFVRWARRNPVVAGLTAALFLSLSAGLAVSVYYGRQATANAALYRTEFERADANAAASRKEFERAEEHLADARRAVEDYFTTVSESTLLDVPGLQPLRRDLLRTAQTYYQQFLDRRASNQALRVQLAVAQNRLGSIHDQLGANDLAEASYGRAVELAGDDGSYEARTERGIAHLGLALQRFGAKDLDAAAKHFDAALALAEQLARERPNDHHAASRLARLRYRRGLFAEARNPRGDKAAAEYEQILAVLGPWRGRRPDDRDVLEPLASANMMLGTYDRRFRRTDQALAHFTAARELAEHALKVRPSNTIADRQLAEIDGHIGSLMLALKRNAEAAESLGRSTERLTRLSAANPDMPALRFALARGLMSQSRLLETTDPAGAAALNERGVAAIEPLVAADPNDVPNRRMLGESLLALGRQRVAAGQPDAGFAALARGVATLEPLARGDKPSPFDINLAANAHLQHGLAHERAKQWAPAAEALTKAVAVQRRAVERLPNSIPMKVDLGTMLGHLADVLEQAGRTGEAASARIEAGTLAGKH